MSAPQAAAHGLTPDQIRMVEESVQIVTGAMNELLDNSRRLTDRADSALCVFHGLFALAVQGAGVDAEYLKDLRERLQLVHEAIDMVEGALKEKH